MARARLLRVSQKREDWGLVEKKDEDGGWDKIEEGREKFVEALCRTDDPAEAARWTDESLRLTMEEGEAMAGAHAREYIERHRNGKGFGRNSFGCTLDWSRWGEDKYRQIIR